MKSKLEGAEGLSESNFREWAKKCIAAYEKKGMLVDAIIWARIIGHYNRALEKVEDA